MSLLPQKRVLVGWRYKVAQAEAKKLGFWSKIQLTRDAADWSVCAIGERSASEPKPHGYPKGIKVLFTREAKDLGFEFTKSINKKNYNKTKEIITKIESLDTIYQPWKGWFHYLNQLVFNRQKSVSGKFVKT